MSRLDSIRDGSSKKGRTGAFYAFQHSGVRADAVGMAKGIANGYPMGAIWTAERHADLFTPGSHGTTFGGTPLACAAALAVLDVVERDDLIAKIVAGWPKRLDSKRARAMGFQSDVSMDEIVRNYVEDDMPKAAA